MPALTAPQLRRTPSTDEGAPFRHLTDGSGGVVQRVFNPSPGHQVHTSSHEEQLSLIGLGDQAHGRIVAHVTG